MRTRPIALLAALAVTLLLAACGGDDDDSLDTSTGGGDAGATQPVGSGDFDDTPDAAGMCLADAPDCDDTAVAGDGDAGGGADGDAIDEGALIAQAEAMLGMPEGDLDPDVRVSRRGNESSAMTEDYRIGRFTVELDDQGSGFVVTKVVLELTEGPQTFR